ncbi:unnamed protein product, partial [Rotaria magnacalcarata]
SSVDHCLVDCLHNIKAFFTWETVVHRMLPNLIIVIVSVALLMRVFGQKYRTHQRVQW